jgi:endo-1,4-beta-D-glucanase Y
MFNTRFVIIFLSALITFIHAAPNFPFPQNYKYKYGIKSDSLKQADIQGAYFTWKTRMYEESGDLARIKFDTLEYTVSEGIGYGMLIMVYMDNASNKTQDEFNKLLNYYRKFRTGTKLMHWKIVAFSNVRQSNSATDAELDVALALLMAYKQWDDESYLKVADTIINAIWKSEVNGNKQLKPGDAWDDAKNPSYLSTAAFEMFKKVNNNDWQTLMANSYALLKKCRNASTGLVPDWCSESGQQVNGWGYDFGADAVRTPWRMAMAYSWFGHQDAMDMNTKMVAWAKSTSSNNPSKLFVGYSISGTARSDWHNAVYTGVMTCAGMISTTHQDWVNRGSQMTSNFTEPLYYNRTLQLLCMLLQSGNMPNLWDLPKSSVRNNNIGRQNFIIAKNRSTINLDQTVFPGYAHFGIDGRLQAQRGKSAKSCIILKPLSVDNVKQVID